MTVESMIASLSQEDKRTALELLWASIERDIATYAPPHWHGQVLADRLNNQSPEPPLPLKDAMKDVRRRINEGRPSP